MTLIRNKKLVEQVKIRDMERNNILEEYNFKESLELEDVDFTEEIKENKNLNVGVVKLYQ
jgi:glutamate mutase epsilon subunit